MRMRDIANELIENAYPPISSMTDFEADLILRAAAANPAIQAAEQRAGDVPDKMIDDVNAHGSLVFIDLPKLAALLTTVRSGNADASTSLDDAQRMVYDAMGTKEAK